MQDVAMRSALQALQDDIEAGAVVVIIGAGVSAAATVGPARQTGSGCCAQVSRRRWTRPEPCRGLGVKRHI